MNLRDVCIGDRVIGQDHSPWIVAEMSANHGQSLERALRIVDEAARAGVHALKLQTYTPETMTLALETGDFRINDPQNIWSGQTLFKLYASAHCPWEWHKPIFDRCRERGLIGFSTPFDETAVDFLEGMNVPLYKVASFENTDIPLIRKIARTGKLLLLSTGMATVDELAESIEVFRRGGGGDLILLKCTSAYPATAAEANLTTILDLQNRFNCLVGISDHTLGIGVSVSGVALGARVVERHFTDSREKGGPDAAFSLEGSEMHQLVQEVERAFLSLGGVHYGPTLSELGMVRYRRSLYITENLKKGDRLTQKNVRCIRPGGGLAPKHLEKVLGQSIDRDVCKGTPLTWDLLKREKIILEQSEH